MTKLKTSYGHDMPKDARKKQKPESTRLPKVHRFESLETTPDVRVVTFKPAVPLRSRLSHRVGTIEMPPSPCNPPPSICLDEVPPLPTFPEIVDGIELDQPDGQLPVDDEDTPVEPAISTKAKRHAASVSLSQ
jgi:hypothetical protein